jgi:hypothetical protein
MSATEGWAVGYDYQNPSGVLLHYSGGTWTSVTPPSVSLDWELMGVHFPSATEGWAVGYDYQNARGVLLHYSGGTWTSVIPPSVGSDWILFGVHFTSATEGWAVGSDAGYDLVEGVLLKYFSIEPPPITLQSPPNGEIFNSCSLTTSYQPTFSWTTTGTYTGFKILFSTSPTDFTTTGIKVTVGSAKGTSSSWKPSSFNWKTIMKSSNNNGSSRPIYWKVVGTKADRTTVQSEVRSFSIGALQTVNINAPLNNAILDPAILPTFDLDTNCSAKFKLEISSLSDFSVSTKIKAFSFTVSNPNLIPSLQKTLSSFQWNGVKKLIGTGAGYFRIKAWDGISRRTVSEVRSFTIQ